MAICSQCNADNAEDAQYCRRCGRNLAGQQPNDLGPGRYILNFFFAGPIGLGLSFFLRRRGWLATWISIPIGIVVISLIVVLIYAATQQIREENAFIEDFNEVMFDLQADYTLPVIRAGLLLETDCTAIEPDPVFADCATYMDTLTEADGNLATTLEELTDLSQRIPDRSPDEVDALFANIIRTLESQHRANEALIDGWERQDSVTWQEGWQLTIDAAIESIDIAQEILQITDELD